MSNYSQETAILERIYELNNHDNKSLFLANLANEYYSTNTRNSRASKDRFMEQFLIERAIKVPFTYLIEYTKLLLNLRAHNVLLSRLNIDDIAEVLDEYCINGTIFTPSIASVYVNKWEQSLMDEHENVVKINNLLLNKYRIMGLNDEFIDFEGYEENIDDIEEEEDEFEENEHMEEEEEEEEGTIFSQ